ncbi:hypothetical protein ASD86_16600 [Lysobacter sp. Root690]|nr:hypothetical protein ASD86_16600 [Lysobacter sp. Root690]
MAIGGDGDGTMASGATAREGLQSRSGCGGGDHRHRYLAVPASSNVPVRHAHKYRASAFIHRVRAQRRAVSKIVDSRPTMAAQNATHTPDCAQPRVGSALPSGRLGDDSATPVTLHRARGEVDCGGK